MWEGKMTINLQSEVWEHQLKHFVMPDNPYYWPFRLANEVGELGGIIDKIIRSAGDFDVSKKDIDAVGSEIADIFIFLSLVAGEWGIDIEDVV